MRRRHLKTIGVILLLVMLLCAVLTASAATMLSPYGDVRTALNTDDAYENVPITDVFSNGINFGGTNYTSIYIGTNGYITFRQGDSSFNPSGITQYANGPIVAAQYDDIDFNLSKNPSSYIYYNQNSSSGYVAVTYVNAGPYSIPVGSGSGTNYFQIVLRRIGGAGSTDFRIEIYYNQLNWAKSGNIEAWPTAGWSAGNGTSYAELPQSGQTSFRDILYGSNCGVAGLYKWDVTGGVVQAQPTVNSTTAASSVTSTTAYSGGNVSSDGGLTVTSRGLCYSTSQNPTISGSTVTAGSGTGSFSAQMTGLQPGTTYYVRAFATNSLGTGYGPQTSFTTSTVSPPTVTTGAATSITASSGVLNGTVTSDGGASVSTRGFMDISSAGSGTGTFSYTWTGLSPNTTYSYYTYAANTAGTGYGSTLYFTTLANAPGLTGTPSCLSNGDVAVTLNKNGNPNNTEYFIQRATDAAFTQNVATALNWTSPGAGSTLTVPKSALSPGTAYYFRVKARNADNIDTAYGTDTVSIPMRVSDASTPTVTPDSSSQITVTWSAAAGAHSYDIYENGVFWVNTSGTSVTRTGLQVNTSYTYEIVSKNTSGDSLKSTAVTKYTLAQVPVAQSASPWQNGTVTVTIDKNGNPDSTSYYVEKAKQSDFSDAAMAADWAAFASGVNTITVSSLDSDTVYYFRVKGRNSDSMATAPGGSASALTAPTTPAKPTATAENRQVTVSWNDARVTSSDMTYRVYRISGGTPTLVDTVINDTSLTVTGLLPNTEYTYAVTAENANGVESAQSPQMSIVTKSDAPQVTAVSGNTHGDVIFTVNPDSNPANTQYLIEKSADSDFSNPAGITAASSWTALDGSGSITVTGLDRGAVWYYRIKARNNNQLTGLDMIETSYAYVDGGVALKGRYDGMTDEQKATLPQSCVDAMMEALLATGSDSDVWEVYFDLTDAQRGDLPQSDIQEILQRAITADDADTIYNIYFSLTNDQKEDLTQTQLNDLLDVVLTSGPLSHQIAIFADLSDGQKAGVRQEQVESLMQNALDSGTVDQLVTAFGSLTDDQRAALPRTQIEDVFETVLSAGDLDDMKDVYGKLTSEQKADLPQTQIDTLMAEIIEAGDIDDIKDIYRGLTSQQKAALPQNEINDIIDVLIAAGDAQEMQDVYYGLTDTQKTALPQTSVNNLLQAVLNADDLTDSNAFYASLTPDQQRALPQGEINALVGANLRSGTAADIENIFDSISSQQRARLPQAQINDVLSSVIGTGNEAKMVEAFAALTPDQRASLPQTSVNTIVAATVAAGNMNGAGGIFGTLTPSQIAALPQNTVNSLIDLSLRSANPASQKEIFDGLSTAQKAAMPQTSVNALLSSVIGTGDLSSMTGLYGSLTPGQKAALPQDSVNALLSSVIGTGDLSSMTGLYGNLTPGQKAALPQAQINALTQAVNNGGSTAAMTTFYGGLTPAQKSALPQKEIDTLMNAVIGTGNAPQIISLYGGLTAAQQSALPQTHINALTNAAIGTGDVNTMMTVFNGLTEAQRAALPGTHIESLSKAVVASGDAALIKKFLGGLTQSQRSSLPQNLQSGLKEKVLSTFVTYIPTNATTGITLVGMDSLVNIPEAESEDVSKVVLEVQAAHQQEYEGPVAAAIETLKQSGKNLLAVVDIQLFKTVYKNDGTSSKSRVLNSDITGMITVRVPLPTEFEGKKDLVIAYIDDQGNATEYPTTLVTEDGKQYLEFQTDHFSSYAIIEKAASLLWLWILLIVLALATGTFVALKVRKSRKAVQLS